MKKIYKVISGLILTVLVFSFINVSPGLAKTPVINAILFYSPSCPHCHQVITEDLPLLIEEYEEQLFIVTINIQTEEGNQIFIDTLEYFGIPREQAGVPLMVVGEEYLFGSVDIPGMLPGMITEGLANDGIPWPNIPSIEELLKREGLFVIEEVSFEPEKLSMAEAFQQDPVANSISVVVLVGMIVVLILSGILVVKGNTRFRPWPKIAFLILMILGIIVANYLSYVEVSQTEAICGPVGDCNTVQQSPYANLFGILPIGLLGVLGYIAIGIVWLTAQFGPEKFQKQSFLVLLGLTAGGTLFSIYLTFLEPFVIGATCAWCLSSAIVMTALLWQSAIYYTDVKG